MNLGSALSSCREVGLFGYARAQRRKRRRPGFLIGVEAPGPLVRSACAGDLQLLYACPDGCCPALGEGRWSLWASQRIGSTTVNVVECRYAFAIVAITATFTVPGSARSFAGASRCAAPRRATNTAVAGASARRAPTGLAPATRTNSDVSGMCSRRVLRQRTRSSDRGERADRCQLSRCRLVPELLSHCAFCRVQLPAWTRMYRGDWSG